MGDQTNPPKLAGFKVHTVLALVVLALVIGYFAGRTSGGAALGQETDGADEQAAADVQRTNAEIIARELLSLSAIGKLERLKRRADELWPVSPELVEDYVAWLAQAEALLADLDSYKKRLWLTRLRAKEPPMPIAAAGHRKASRLDAARAKLQEVVDEHGALSEQVPETNETLRALEAKMIQARVAVLTLEREVSGAAEWEFDSSKESWFHDQLSALVEDLEALRHPDTGLIDGASLAHGPGIRPRLEFARTMHERTVGGAEAERLWAEALASIASPEECPMYGGLTLAPQLGLLPLGRDPRSGLWEFAHLFSGSVPERDAATGELTIDGTNGVILVLLPGGRFTMGAQAGDGDGANYCAHALDDESPTHDVTLAPFFASKFELTQGQWQRATGQNPSSFLPPGASRENANPVEQVTWVQCSRVLSWLALSLPTEAQWEYAARAGTSSSWWTGAERASLVGTVNLADRAASRGGANWPTIADWPELDDGYLFHAPVSSFTPNAFGLHHVHGNVWEWCRDWYGNYGLPVTEGDAERQTEGTRVGLGRQFGGTPFPEAVGQEPRNVLGARVLRGGGFKAAATSARSAFRGHRPEGLARSNLGVRPVRAIR